jgi:hypothetical protein
VPASVLPAAAAAAAFDVLVRFISSALAALLAAGLVVAAGAFLTGPAATAVRIRGALATVLGGVHRRGERAGVQMGPAGAWTYPHRGEHPDRAPGRLE